MKVLIDTNVVVDVLQQREPWFSDGAAIFTAVANRQIVGCLSSRQIADLYFFSRKQFKGQENVDAKARQVIKFLAGKPTGLPVGGTAINLPFFALQDNYYAYLSILSF